ncbi:MAG TPA: hypothetical protein VN375_20210 [Vicinamibacteria bacterium]|jgi:hypothetical protein|nr:hypothetical protein [Vicinamibacteria bacterium]
MNEPEWSVPLMEPFAWAAPGAGAERPDLGSLEESHTGEKVLEYTELGAHIVTTTAEITEMFEKELLTEVVVGGEVVGEVPVAAGGVMVAAEVIAPLGSVLVIGITARELYSAFTVVQRIEHAKGMAYGMMWEVLGLPDTDRTTRPGALGLPEQMTESEREAWRDGVEEGRRAVREDPAVRADIERSLAYEMAVQHRDLATDPQHTAWRTAVANTLGRVWEMERPQEGPEGRALAHSGLDWISESDGFPTK